MATPDLFLITFIIIGVIGRVSTLSVAASLLLAARMLRLNAYLPIVERRSLELGLLFLMVSILAPLASGKLTAHDLMTNLLSIAGLATVIGGVLATVLNSKGLALLQKSPSLLMSVVVGSIIGIVLFRGTPVGPLMATSIAALIVNVIQWFK